MEVLSQKVRHRLAVSLLFGWWWAPLRWLALPYLWHYEQQMRLIRGEDVER